MNEIPVVYEDPDFLVVAKPEGCAAIPEREGDRECLLARVAAARGERLLAPHRLDKEVSGALVLARSPEAHRWLANCFRQRQVEKEYLALVHGRMERDRGRIQRPLREFGSGRVSVDPRQGKPAITEFEVLERTPNFSLIKVRPLTGRRHQIRAHFYHLGHPIVGDRRYGQRRQQEAFPRLMLHASRVAFPTPSGQRVCVEVPPPESFDRVLKACLSGRSSEI